MEDIKILLKKIQMGHSNMRMRGTGRHTSEEHLSVPTNLVGTIKTKGKNGHIWERCINDKETSDT